MSHFSWYYLVYALPCTFLWGMDRGGIYAWCTPILFIGVFPLIDYLLGISKTNPKAESESQLQASWGYKLAVWFWLPVQLALIIKGLNVVINGNLSSWDNVGITISVGMLTGAFGITWAHELCHRTSKLERAFAEILLSSVSYTHFAIEHVYGHHKNVATPEDPASAKLNENFYTFYINVVYKSLHSAWCIEINRLKRKALPIINIHNRMLRYCLEQIIIYSTVWFFFNWQGIAFFLIQAIIAFSMLEAIDYIEHYGLARKKLASGKYERIQLQHSWDCSFIFSNIILLNLPRHSDHHYKTSNRYQLLRHFDVSPQLPAGYIAMFLLALVPPLWFKVMNPRVETWLQQYG